MVELVAACMFGFVALLSFAVLHPVMSRRFNVRARIDKLMPEREAELTLMPDQKSWQRVLAEMGSKLKLRGGDLRVYGDEIAAAGFRRESVQIYLGVKVILAVLLPSVYLAIFTLFHDAAADTNSLAIAVACAIAGFLLPTWGLNHLAAKRKTEIFHSLPDVLDLLTVCVEAGLSLEAAMVKTIDNFEQKDCPLIREMNAVLLEIRAGKNRSEALKGLAERTMVDDVRSLVSMLVQTERFGTSLGKTLRTFSDSMRTRRKQLAEERAAKTGVKMLFPLTIFIFPGILVVLLVPAMVRIFGIFKP